MRDASTDGDAGSDARCLAGDHVTAGDVEYLDHGGRVVFRVLAVVRVVAWVLVAFALGTSTAFVAGWIIDTVPVLRRGSLPAVVGLIIGGLMLAQVWVAIGLWRVVARFWGRGGVGAGPGGQDGGQGHSDGERDGEDAARVV